MTPPSRSFAYPSRSIAYPSPQPSPPRGEGARFAVWLAVVAIGWLLVAGGAPAAAENAPRFAYVTNQNGETVSVVDLETFKVAATIAVPGKCAGVAVSPVADRVFVSCPDAHDVAVIDTKTNTVIARWPAGKGPLGIAVAPADWKFTEHLFVADWYDKFVHVLDTVDGHRVADIEVGQSPSGFAGHFWDTLAVADRDSNTVSFIDVQNNKRIGHVSVGERPFGMSMYARADTDRKMGAFFFTANVGSDDVSVVFGPYDNLRTVGTIKVGRRPYAVSVGIAGPYYRAFVTDQYGGTISVIDIPFSTKFDDLKRTAVIEACDHPEGINYDWSRKAIYVACWFDNKLIRIDAESLKITGEVAVGDGPRAFGNFIK